MKFFSREISTFYEIKVVHIISYPYLFSSPSLRACRAILVTLIESTRNGKFWFSFNDIKYMSLDKGKSSGVITRYNGWINPRHPTPLKSVAGSLPWKPICSQWLPNRGQSSFDPVKSLYKVNKTSKCSGFSSVNCFY